MQEVRLAYLAGFLDGEGTIGIQHAIGQKKRLLKNGKISIYKCGYYVLYTSIASRSKEALSFALNLFGGSISSYKRGEMQAPLFRWHVSARKARIFLEAVQPYCIIKREHINTAFAFSQANSPGEREYYKQMLHVLNRKGPNDKPTAIPLKGILPL